MFETSLKYGLLLWQLWNANHIVIVSLDWHVMRLFCLYKSYGAMAQDLKQTRVPVCTEGRI